MNTVVDAYPAEATTPIERNGLSIAISFLIIAILLIAPLAVIDTPLLADYPNHVARIHALSNFNDNSLLAERYTASADLIPNIAMDLAVPWLMNWMPLDVASRVFLASILVSTLAGVAWLHRTLFNQWSGYPLLAALFCYHGSLMAGMANFSFGIALVPAALALWIRMQDAKAVWRLRPFDHWLRIRPSSPTFEPARRRAAGRDRVRHRRRQRIPAAHAFHEARTRR